MQPVPPGPGPRLTAAVLLLSSLTIMANAAIAPSLPAIKEHFAATPGIETLSPLLMVLPSASIVLTAGLFGWLADRMDRQRLLLIAALLYAIGGSSGLWAQGLVQMLIGRVVLGVGVAGTMTLAMVWATDLWQGPARAEFLGRQGAAMSFGGIVVILAGGALAVLHWRGAFAVYLLVLPIAVLALTTLAPHAKAVRARQRAEAARVHEPFPWLALLLVGGLAFAFMAFFYVMPTRLPFLLHDLGTTNTLVTAAIMASITLASIPGALNYGRIRKHMSAMAVFAMSFSLLGTGMVIISQATGPGLVVVGALVAGLGLGPAMPNYTTYLMAFVPPTQRGRASGLLTTAFFAGQFAAPLVAAPLVSAYSLPGAFGALGLAQLVLAAGLAVAAAARLGAMPAPVPSAQV